MTKLTIKIKGSIRYLAALLVLVLLGFLLAGCTNLPPASKATETGETKTGTVSEEGAVPYASVGGGVPEVEDPCTKEREMQQELNSLAKILTEAEAELEGLKIDLDFALEDGSSTLEIEELIKNQEKYIESINSRMAELQQSLAECGGG